MKKIIRLTESDLHRIIKKSVNKILKEDVLGNNWHEYDNTSALNNYEPFENQIERYKDEEDFRNQYDWGAEGENQIDPTYYSQHNDVIGWNDDEPEGYEEDPDQYKDEWDGDISDGDLYRGVW